MTKNQQIKIEVELIEDLIDSINRNKEWMFSKYEIIEWLERQKSIINNQ